MEANVGDLFEKILSQRAADAAVLHLDHALFHADGTRAGSLDQSCVDVDLCGLVKGRCNATQACTADCELQD